MRSILLAISVLVLASCAAEKEPGSAQKEAWKAELLSADSAFSAMSVRDGSVAAFQAWIAPDGRALPQQGYPRSRDDFTRLLEQQEGEPRTSTLTWTPLMADVATSGDLGYTHGRYAYTSQDDDGATSITNGYYVTVWKRQPDGKWRFVMDAGNEAGPESP